MTLFKTLFRGRWNQTGNKVLGTQGSQKIYCATIHTKLYWWLFEQCVSTHNLLHSDTYCNGCPYGNEPWFNYSKSVVSVYFVYVLSFELPTVKRVYGCVSVRTVQQHSLLAEISFSWIMYPFHNDQVIKLLFWPLNSPQINPVKHVWDVLEWNFTDPWRLHL